MTLDDPNLTVEAATPAERPLLERLVQLYLHDFSEFAEVGSPYGEVGSDGLFDGFDLDRYERDPNRASQIFRIGGAPVGFSLINDWSASGLPVDHAIAEFFVMRKYRRCGVGLAAARRLILARPGRWEIPVASYNAPAQRFWRAFAESLRPLAIEELEGAEDRWSGPILRFAAPGRKVSGPADRKGAARP